MFNKIGNIKLLPPVSWFNLKQLAGTAYKSIISSIIGEQSDRRLMLALASSEKEFYNYTRYHKNVNGKIVPNEDSKRKEMWLDFIADTGDGWNPTYSIAYYAAKQGLKLNFGDKQFDTKRGEVLIFGGDEVYPTPSKKGYKERLITPYEQAFGDDKPETPPHVFAIPGNHDWYDGLESFTRLFCSDLGSRKFAGGWFSRQKRSYFALKLPNKWWLLASDGQLHSNIDTAQLDYFRAIADAHMSEGDKVILCISEPVWIYAHKYKKFGAEYDESDLIYLQEEILKPRGAEVKVFLTGDLHHYRRHEELNAKEKNAKVQKITAGGGGAFMHPTHGGDFSLLTEEQQLPGQKPREFELKKSYPDVKTSKRLGWLNIFFPFTNPGFGILTGTFYLITIWIVSSTFHFEFAHNVRGFFDQTLRAFLVNPVAALWLGAVAAGFVFFTDTHSKWYKWLGGLTHFFMNLFSIAYIGLFATYINNTVFNEGVITGFIFIPIIVFALGWFFGSLNMGIYLTVSMNIFGRHDNEAFSALRIQDYKNFLRLNIDDEGTLTIFPIKIQKAARKWRFRKSGEADNSFIVPEDGSIPELIEEPIVIRNDK
ncbi:MAG TPA: metallophosphoesterase [Ignavibacteria bacterium]|nr:metallophosphoesterase [Ignavibacteria bacterium]HRF66874.1 metallophosphoesterase [Ignavibacteria bacterium]HRJ03758.1 metallophosphoesterase [Ignavibacteria bacterium]